MTIENLLPLGEIQSPDIVRPSLTVSRAHRQMCGFADLGHHERRKGVYWETSRFRRLRQ
jgi:hypothetical protein